MVVIVGIVGLKEIGSLLYCIWELYIGFMFTGVLCYEYFESYYVGIWAGLSDFTDLCDMTGLFD